MYAASSKQGKHLQTCLLECRLCCPTLTLWLPACFTHTQWVLSCFFYFFLIFLFFPPLCCCHFCTLQACFICHIYCFSSQTSYVLQPQVYGYDDLQMLQTRIPLVRGCSCLISWSVWYENNSAGFVCGIWSCKHNFLLMQDYYSIPFATPTTALTGREGSLTSNPYSGKMHSSLVCALHSVSGEGNLNVLSQMLHFWKCCF